jgi:hypothetical protein
MVNLLCDLLELPEPVISFGSTTWTENRSAIDRLSRLGALTQSDAVRTVPCPACDEHHYVRVESTEAGAFRAYCHVEGFLPIDAADLTVLQVDVPWLIEALRMGISVLSRPVAQELVPGHLWFLGEQRVKAYRTRFYLGRRLTDLASVEQAVAALAAKPVTMPGLLLTSSSCAPLVGLLPKRHAAICPTCVGQGPKFLKLGGRIAYRLEDIEAFEQQHLRSCTSTDPGILAVARSA